MKNPYLLIVCGALVVLSVGATVSLSATSTTANPQQAHAASADSNSQRVAGVKAIELPEDVFVDLSVSILPPVVTQAGAAARSACVTAQYQHKTTFIGGTRYHELVPSTSSQAIDLSADDLEINLQDDSATPREPNTGVFRSFSTTVRPRSGLTWGDVKSFENDIVIVSAPTK
jgi:hypothetical protein